VSGVHTHRQILTIDGKMGNFLSATSHVAHSEVFPGEMNDIILSENSLNGATPVAIEPELRTDIHVVDELYRVCPQTCFCARRPKSNNFFPGLSQKTFTVVFLPTPAVKLR